MSMFEMHQK